MAHTEVKSFNKHSRHSTTNFSHGRYDARIIKGYVAKLRDILDWLGKFPAKSEIEINSSWLPVGYIVKVEIMSLVVRERTNIPLLDAIKRLYNQTTRAAI